jgi:RNA polymerase sigma-70 factor, ECF subfamily
MKRPEKQDPSDEDLLNRARSGDTVAFGDLYQRHLTEIYRYIYYRVGDALDAEDLTETVFLKAWQALPRFYPQNTALAPWLYRIAHNTIIDFYRTSKLDQNLPSTLPDHNPSPETQAEQNQQHVHMLQHLHHLEERLQQVLILRFLNDLTPQQVAQIMEITPAHVRVLQHRALKKMQSLLDEQE